MEIENLLTILEGFYKSMSGTQAFANAYYGRFEQSKVMGSLRQIMDKLGIEKAGYGDYSRKQNNFFSGNSMNPPENAVESKYDAYGMLGESYEE